MKYMFFLTMIVISFFSHSKEYERKNLDHRIIGSVDAYNMKDGETINDVAKKFNVSELQLIAANPLIDPITSRNLILKIPTKKIIPNVSNEGIVVNLAEMRLYYFPEDENKIYVFPVGIGRIGWETQTMETEISQMIKSPTWTPTPRIRSAHFKKHGKHLPDVMPAGPNNPLGQYAMRLNYSNGSYLIHGTNKTVGSGMRISSGCIRMNPHDVATLFSKVSKGTKVKIINEPLKYTETLDGSVYVEVHKPMSKTWSEVEEIKKIEPPKDLLTKTLDQDTAFLNLSFALQNQTGIPLKIK